MAKRRINDDYLYYMTTRGKLDDTDNDSYNKWLQYRQEAEDDEEEYNPLTTDQNPYLQEQYQQQQAITTGNNVTGTRTTDQELQYAQNYLDTNIGNKKNANYINNLLNNYTYEKEAGGLFGGDSVIEDQYLKDRGYYSKSVDEDEGTESESWFGGDAKNKKSAKELKKEIQQLTGADDKTFEKYAQYQQELFDADYNDWEKENASKRVNTGNTAKDILGGIGNTITSWAYNANPLNLISTAKETYDQKDKADDQAPVNVYAPGYRAENKSSALSEETENAIDSKWGKKAYEIGNSTGQSAVGALVGGALGEGATLASFADTAGVQSLKEGSQRGLDYEHNVKTAVATGSAEAAFEKLSLDKLYDIAKKKGFSFTKDVVKDWIIQSGIEGSEEVATDLANNISDRIINGDKSEYETNVANEKQRLIDEGMNEKDAKKKAVFNVHMSMVEDLAQSFAAGTISGALLGGGATATNTVYKSFAARNLVNDAGGYTGVISKIDGTKYTSKEATDKSLEARDLAQELALKDQDGITITDKENRTLYDLIYDADQAEYDATHPQQEKKSLAGKAINFVKDKVTNKSQTVSEEDTAEAESSEETQEENNSIQVRDTRDSDENTYGSEHIPEEIKTRQNNSSAEEIETAMVEAKKSGDAAALVQAKRTADLSTNKAAQQTANDLYGYYSKQMISNGDTTRAELTDLESRATREQAYDAGLNNRSITGLDEQTNADYEAGRAKRLELQSQQKVDTTESFGGVKVENVDGRAVLKKGNTILEAQNIEDTNARGIFEDAVAQTSAVAQESYADLYQSDALGVPRASYKTAWSKMFTAGAQGTMSKSDALKRYSYLTSRLSEETLGKMYDIGTQERNSNKENAKGNKKTVTRKGEGKVVDKRSKKSKSDYTPLLQAVAKATGLDIEIRDDLDSQINGSFDRAMGKITFNANSKKAFQTLFHEAAGEFSEAWNSAGMRDVQDKILEWMAETKGEDYVKKLGDAYQESYREFGQRTGDSAEANKTYREALDEMVNDTLYELFTSEEGVQQFNDWLADNTSEIERKGIMQKIADFLDKIAKSMRSMIKKSGITGERLRLAEMEADKAEEIRKAVLDTLSGAKQNYANAEVRTSAGTESDVHSIDTLFDSAAMSYEKDAQGRTVILDANGNEVNHVTPKMIRNSPIGALLAHTEESRGFLEKGESEKQMKFLADTMNMMLKTRDIDLIWAVNSTIGFQELAAGPRTSLNTNSVKSKATGFTTNSDPQYSTTVDFTTICLKTQALINVMSDTMKELGHGLTDSEIVKIVYDQTHKSGNPVPCPVCYVFSRWVGLGGLFDKINNFQKEYPLSKKEAEKRGIPLDSPFVTENGMSADKKALLDEIDNSIEELWKKSGHKKSAYGKSKNEIYENVKNEWKRLDMQHKSSQKEGSNVEDLTKEQKEKYNHLSKVIDMMDNWAWFHDVRSNPNYKPVPNEILFDLNAGKKFADDYPLTWRYRTTRGPAMVKAAMPYADENIGQIIRGIGSPGIIKKNLGDLHKDPLLYEKNGSKYEKIADGNLRKAAKTAITRAITNAAQQNLLNGQRLQSTSDFRYEYALDTLMSLIELQSVGAMAQEYTKVPESVGFLASSGVEVNCSLMPLGYGYKAETDSNGKVILAEDGMPKPKLDKDGNVQLTFSSVTGMSAEDAFRLSNMYDNVQPIMVGTSNTHIRACMADDRITFIIPYHASGSNTERYQDMMNTLNESVVDRTNYEQYQSDHTMSTAEIMIENRISKTAAQDIERARDIRKNIVSGKYYRPFAKRSYVSLDTVKQTGQHSDREIIRDNDVLNQLYQRFYGEDVDGNPAKIQNKYLDKADQGSNGYGTTDRNTYHNFISNGSAASVIMPYEYWDKSITIDNSKENGANFADYCASMGIRPRFSGYNASGNYNSEFDFTNEDGYWKVLPDRAMYNLDGTYHEQQRVNVSNMKPEYLSGLTTVEGEQVFSRERKNTFDNGEVIKNPSKGENFEGIKSAVAKSVEAVRAGRLTHSINVDSDGQQLTDAQKEYFKDSKAVDDQGRLLKLYHGARNAGYHIFDKSRINSGSGFWFSSDKDTAESYSKTNDEYQARKYINVDDLNKEIMSGLGFEVKKTGRGYALTEEDDDEVLETAQDMNDLVTWAISNSRVSANYAVYLNLTNPKVVDAQERSWDQVGDYDHAARSIEYAYLYSQAGDNQWEIEYEEESEYKTKVFSTSELEKYFGSENAKLLMNGDEIDNVLLDKDGNNIQKTTNDVTNEAFAEGYDGVIFKNVFDGNDVPSDVYVAFDSNQIKSVANENPTENDDIRYSLDMDFDPFDLGDEDLDSVWIDEKGNDHGVSYQQQSKGKMASILEEGAKLSGTVSKTKLREIANKYRREYGSAYNLNTLTDNLEKAFAYMQNNGSVDYQDMMSVMQEIAMPVIETAKVDSRSQEEWNNFKASMKGTTIRLNDAQKQEVRSQFGTVSEWVKSLKGAIKVNDKTGKNLDDMWQQIAQANSAYLNEFIESDANEPLALTDAVNILSPKAVTSAEKEGMSNSDLAYDLAMQIIHDYYDSTEVQKKINAEKDKFRQRLKESYDKRLANELKKQRERLMEQNERAIERVTNAAQKEFENKAEMAADYKKRMQEAEAEAKRIAKSKASAKQTYEDRKARSDAKAQREKTGALVNELRDWMISPNDQHHIPTSMAKPVAQLLSCFDFVQPRITHYTSGPHKGMWGASIFEYYDDFNQKSVFNWVGASTRESAYYEVEKHIQQQLINGSGTKTRSKWQERMKPVVDFLNDSRMEKETDSETYMFGSMMDPDLADELNAIINEKIPATAYLDANQLKSINKLLRNLKTAINQQNRFFMDNRFTTIANSAQNAINFMTKKKAHVDNQGVKQTVWHLLNVSMVTPSTFFHIIGADDIYKGIRSGMEQRTWDIKDASEYMENLTDGIKDVHKWGKETVKIKSIEGKDMTFSKTQIMSLYELNNREAAVRHFTGGFTTDNINGKQVNGIESQHLTREQINQLIGTLSEDQKKVADGMQRFMADQCSKWGNEVSNIMFGYEKYTEKNYFPMTVESNSLNTKSGDVNRLANSIANLGFTKSLNDKATNPLRIRDIFDVFSDHVTDIATYHGYALPMSDTLRWLNYREIIHEKNGDQKNRNDAYSTKNAISRVGGKDYLGYITNLIRDINSESSSGNGEERFANKLISNYKAAAVGANLRVAIQQPTAYVRAAAVVSPKYLIGAMSNINMIANAREAQENNATAYWKSKGYYDNSMGQSLKQIITGESTVMDEIRDKTSILSQIGDDWTWGILYKAVEAEQRDQHKDLKEDSEEFRKAVNDRFADVVDQTQVVDSVLHRSQFMRSKDTLVKIEAAFQAEPTKTYNLLYRAVMDGDKTQIARSGFAFAVTTAVCAAAASVMDAFRNDDDDEEWGKRWLEAFLGLDGSEESVKDYIVNLINGNLGSGLNIAALLPYVKDIFSMMSGYDVERLDTAGISNMLQSANNILKYVQGGGTKSGYGVSKEFVKAFSQLTGVPAYGAWREVESIHNAFFDNWASDKPTGSGILKEAIGMYVETEDSGKTGEVDQDAVKDMTEKMKSASDDIEYAVYYAIREKLKDGYSLDDAKDAVQKSISTTYKSQYYELSQEDKATAKELANKLKEAYGLAGMDDEKINDKLDGWDNVDVSDDKIDSALKSGSSSKLSEAIKTVTKELETNGKSDSDIQSHVKSEITSYYKKAHEEGLSDSETLNGIKKAYGQLNLKGDDGNALDLDKEGRNMVCKWNLSDYEDEVKEKYQSGSISSSQAMSMLESKYLETYSWRDSTDKQKQSAAEKYAKKVNKW